MHRLYQSTHTFYQYSSVRMEKRAGGTISTGRHSSEWVEAGGMRLCGLDDMIVAIEGYTGGKNRPPSRCNGKWRIRHREAAGLTSK